MNLRRDIKPITYLKNRTTDVVQEVSEGRTIVITQNGEAKMVIIGVEEYDRLQSALALLKIVQHSEADVKAGRTISQEQVFERIERLIEDVKPRSTRSRA
jgi:prevent-host-death family protein